MDQAKVRVIVPEINGALKALGEKHNVKFSTGRANYSNTDFTVKLDCLDLAATDGATNKEELEYQKRHSYYGLPADGLGRAFTHLGKSFTITGLNCKRPKYPVSARGDHDGKSYKFPAIAVTSGMKTG